MSKGLVDWKCGEVEDTTDTAQSECNGWLCGFEEWLKTVCFQKPTREAYDLARDAWKEGRKTARPLTLTDSDNPFCDNCKEEYCLVSFDNTCAMIRVYLRKT
jgi:hypothetical protein